MAVKKLKNLAVEVEWMLKTKCMRNSSFGLAVEFKHFVNQYFTFSVYFQLQDREKHKETKSQRGINVASQPCGGM